MSKTKKQFMSPLIDTITDPEQFAQSFGASKSAVEQVAKRQRQADAIAEYYCNTERYERRSIEAEACQAALTVILNDSLDNNRLTLYLPFDLFESSNFAKEVMPIWQTLLDDEDAREDFACGNIWQSKTGEKVVQAMRMLPWLLICEAVTEEDVLALIRAEGISNDAKLSIFDCIEIFEDWELMSKDALAELKAAADNFDFKRQYDNEFMKTRSRCANTESSIRYHVRNSWSRNVDNATKQIGKHLGGPSGDIIHIITGPELHGYAYDGEVLRINGYHIAEIEAFGPEQADLIFNSVWYGDEAAKEQRIRVARRILELPEGSSGRREALKKLEADALQYDLMHKAYHYALSDVSKVTKSYKSMDGYSAYYDPRFRRDACILYAKYVFLPRL